jgi:protein TonB
MIMKSKKTPKSDLQNKKIIFLEIGISVALTIVLVAFNWSSKERREAVLVAVEPKTVIGFEELVPVTTQEIPVPGDVKIQIPNELILIVDEPITIPGLSFASSKHHEGHKFDWSVVDKLPQLKKDDDVIEDYPKVKVKPLFQGKDAREFSKWIYSQLVYPPKALENGIQGSVVVSFIVNTDGSLSDIRSTKKVDALLEEAVLEIVRNSPEWTPGINDKPVRVSYQVSIVFKIQN